MTGSFDEVMSKLKSKARPDQLEGMARFGMSTSQRLGISMPELRKLGKEIGRKHQLALQLWDTKIAEAMILAALVDDPSEVTEEQADSWVMDLDSWDVCDQLCMNLLDKVPFALKKIKEWSRRDEEFVKRAAFALIAVLAWHDKDASDDFFVSFFPIIKEGVTDERNFVKKAVNWALRHIGKRNAALNKKAIKFSKVLLQMDSKSARWIAADAIKELESESIKKRLNIS
ncbi:MAG: DNA alkylation repair protein [Actinobacteria bacterium]|nr:MAG: DNA alkylation repair protein [Actinomycetota bacterium]